jgi:hypothetical protein
MAKRGRPRIHPPKTPKGEDPKVTIGNLERQVRLLTDRCAELNEKRDEAMAEADISEGLAKLANERADNLEKVVLRMEGYRDFAREIIGSIELPLTSSLP